ncbi:13605_t:CDS:2, partial [Dentiscutata heterogama]
QEYPTFWQSHTVDIQLGRGEIRYKYGIFNRGAVEYEEENDKYSRTLDISTNDQYDMWQNNNRYNICSLGEFAFIKCIYDAVNTENLKDKHCQSKVDKRLFLCVFLGYYFKDARALNHQLPTHFRSDLLFEALENVQEDTFTSDIKLIMAPVVAALVRHNAIVMVSFDWLRVFRVAQLLDPRYTFVDGIFGVRYDKEQISRLLKEWPKVVKPY